MNLRFVLVLFLLIPLGCEGCSDSGSTTGTLDEKTDGLQKVQLQLNWFPEAEHGGFYAALQNGHYEEEGLDVEILPGGPNVPVVQSVAGRKVTFGISNADRVLLGQAQEAPVTAVMAPLQNSPRCIMVHEESGIREFEGLKNVTLAMSSAPAFSHYLRKKLPLTGVQIVPYPGNVSQFLLNDDYAQQAYVFSEPFVAEKQGADTHCLMVSDLGFNPYTSVLITHAETVRDQPELVQKMVRASVRGWKDYLENPEPTNRMIHDQNPEMEMKILAYGAEMLVPLCLPESMSPDQLGRMTADRWQTLRDQLIEVKLVDPDSVALEEAFTAEFLEKSAVSTEP